MQQHHCQLLIIGDNKDIKDESYLCDRACMCLFLERCAKNTVDYNWLSHREMVGLLLLRGSLESMVSWVVMETIVFCLSCDWCCRVEQVYAISVFFNTFSLLSFSASSLTHKCSCFAPIVIFSHSINPFNDSKPTKRLSMRLANDLLIHWCRDPM